MDDEPLAPLHWLPDDLLDGTFAEDKARAGLPGDAPLLD